MKTNLTKLVLTLTVAAVCWSSRAQQENDPQPAEENDIAAAAAAAAAALSAQGFGATNSDGQQAVTDLIQSVLEAQQQLNRGADTNAPSADPRSFRPIRGRGARGTAGSGTNAIPLSTLVSHRGTNGVAAAEKNLRLNFRNAPLSMVLDYLSDAAGFTISANSKVDLKGTVTVWSNQPVSRDEAVQVLHQALSEHSYAATVEGSVLNIYVVDSSNTEIVPGLPTDYRAIPPTKDLVTQIAYVHNVEASQLINTLQPLMPNGTSMTANQGANAIVITDTKANIRRMAQLVKALDTASVSASEMKVFPLEYADATALAQVITQLFQTDSSNQNNRGRFGGFPPFGPFGGGDRNRGGDSGSSGTPAGRMTAAKVTAVADERSNSLVVSASADQMKSIEDLVKQMDVNVDELTEVRVFKLHYADPQEIADQLTSLYPDPSQQQNSRNRQFGFRGFFGGGGPTTGNNNSSTQNSRNSKQTRVTAVADPRTGSVIVSAAQQMMGQVRDLIEELDSDPAKKKKVHVIKVENRDPQDVVEELQSIIAADTSSGTFNNTRNNNRQTGSQLNTRQQNNLQNTGNRTTTFGNSRPIGQ